ncbi:MAG: hypothetical protein PF517_03400 [Salinivirgaceae bacterium]|jgi:hypothetical protein|nr:hypothetical protein [Salinivirgaceae bacterium]
MKKIILIVLAIYSTFGAEAQYTMQMDVAIGKTLNSDFTMGFYLKNMKGNIGMYFGSYGSGRVTPIGLSSVDYSSIADDVIITENTIDNPDDVFAIVGGVTLNAQAVFKNMLSDRLNFLIGVGMCDRYKYQTDSYHYVFDYVSDEYAYRTYENSHIKKAVLDLVVSCNIIDAEGFIFGIDVGYNTGMGVSARGFLGWKLVI